MIMKNTLLCLVLVGLSSQSKLLAQTTQVPAAPSPASYLESFYAFKHQPGTPETTFVPTIAVSSPAYGSEVEGDVKVTFQARGMVSAHALCWQQPTAERPDNLGHDQDVAPGLQLDADGKGNFVFHADNFPNGPINLRIFTKDGGLKQDYCELQLFNRGGVVWNQGIPKSPPPAAAGMNVVFEDDFNGPLSIGKENSTKYWTHWSGGDGSSWPFAENEGPLNPFLQVKGRLKNYLRIRASKPEGTKGSAGSLTPVHPDHSGFTTTAPCYFECRFLAQNATGIWPAFWLTTQGGMGTDEMDVIEAYGTNSKTGGIWTPYHVTTHFWGQPTPAWVTNRAKGPDGQLYDAHRMVDPMAVGGKSSWSTTFHTYGVLITPEFTAYYLDNTEVLRHPSGQVSATRPMSFLVNLAVGGGWPVDLQRYDNHSDMWIDYVRVYHGK